jgi:hypothetical protein
MFISRVDKQSGLNAAKIFSKNMIKICNGTWAQ